ncbi:MAG: flagellar filament capping protein FliD [Dissulfurispiraceae bacterium]|jgi:flagellar hook-associated protein 2
MSTSPVNVSGLLQAFGLNSGSNIDVNTIVSELMQVDEQPLTNLMQTVTNYQTDISAYGTILSNLSSLQSSVKAMQNGTVGLAATPSDPSYFTATVSSGESATAGTTAIDIQHLATAQSIYSTAVFTTASSPVAVLSPGGKQQLEIQDGSNAPVTITVNGNNNTLSGIAGAINSSKAGVTASVLEVSANDYKLVLTSSATGSSNTITVKVDESGNNFVGWSESGVNTDMTGLSQLAYDTANHVNNMTQSVGAADAALSVNGILITRPSNTVTNAVPGVTLNLLQANDPSGSDTSPLSLNLTASSDSLASELNSFVSAYNTALSTINTYYQPKSQNSTSSSSQQGLLSGDDILLTLRNTLMNVTTNIYGSEANLGNNSLAYIGVTHDSNGVLQFDPSKLSAAYQTDSANITTMVNNMANSFGSALYNFINTTIPSEQNGFQTQVTSLQNQENVLAEQLSYEQTTLTTEYTALSNLVTSDNSISNYLTEQTDLQDKQNSGGA